jgi:hypothetical protein
MFFLENQRSSSLISGVTAAFDARADSLTPENRIHLERGVQLQCRKTWL